MSEVFLDTNVLLYAVDDKDSAKRDRARQWLTVCWQRRCGRLSTQVLNEFYANARRKFETAFVSGKKITTRGGYRVWCAEARPADPGTIQRA